MAYMFTFQTKSALRTLTHPYPEQILQKIKTINIKFGVKNAPHVFQSFKQTSEHLSEQDHVEPCEYELKTES